MGKWMNSNNHRKVTDHTFATQIGQRCMFDGKKEIPYMTLEIVFLEQSYSSLYSG